MLQKRQYPWLTFFTLKLAENVLLRHENNHRLQAITVKESSSISTSDKELVIREREFCLVQEIKLNNLLEEVLDVGGTMLCCAPM